MTSLSSILSTGAGTLTTATGHAWAAAIPFDVPVRGTRQGRLFVPFLAEPKGLEHWQRETDLILQTQLMVLSTDSNIPELAYDYAIALHSHVKSSFTGVAVQARGGDRHLAVNVTNRQENERLPADVVLITTTHLYTAQAKTGFVSL